MSPSIVRRAKTPRKSGVGCAGRAHERAIKTFSNIAGLGHPTHVLGGGEDTPFISSRLVVEEVHLHKPILVPQTRGEAHVMEGVIGVLRYRAGESLQVPFPHSRILDRAHCQSMLSLVDSSREK